MSWYIVTKTVKGRRYRYRQRTWREGGRVRTESIYLGAVDESASVGPRARKRKWGGIRDFIEAQRMSPEDRAMTVAEKHAAKIAAEQRERFGATAEELRERERLAALASLHQAYGLRLSDSSVVKGSSPERCEDPQAASAPSVPQPTD